MDGLFGTGVRTDVLVSVGRLGETYARELEVILGRRVSEVQRALASLEEAGVVSTRLRGRTRIATLNPRFPARETLYELLLEMSSWPRYEGMWAVRRRPRAAGKAL